jgi:hypothetical protein
MADQSAHTAIWDPAAAESAKNMQEAADRAETEHEAKALERANRRYFWKSLGMDRGPSKPKAGPR